MLRSSHTSLGIDLDEIESTPQPLILVVDDEQDTVRLLHRLLILSGFNVASASSGREAIKIVSEQMPDLILLDLILPEMDGWQALKNFHKITTAPVIILSALSKKEEIISGLRKGVDDYITKPFHNDELVERIKTVLRRASRPKPDIHLNFPIARLAINLEGQQVILNGQEVYLTHNEYELVSLLAKKAPAIVDYRTIAETVWRKDSPEIRNRTKYLVYQLRRKFEEVFPGENLILNFDRRGYKLRTEL